MKNTYKPNCTTATKDHSSKNSTFETNVSMSVSQLDKAVSKLKTNLKMNELVCSQ